MPRLTRYFVLPALLLLLFFFSPGLALGASLLGQNVQGGGTVEVKFPVPKYFQDVAAEGGNPRVETGRAVLTFPNGFDPSRRWPILIVTSTSDFNRTSPMDVEWYRRPATAEGWVILASDATVKPKADSTPWRLGMLAAALEAVRKEWPQSAKWPVAFAGFSGGAKRSGLLGAMLAKTGSINLCGFFLSGINDDRLTDAYRTYKPGGNFLNTPVWLSSGMNDNIATTAAHDQVNRSLRNAGFKNVRMERFAGGHQLRRAEVQRALRWFREVGRF